MKLRLPSTRRVITDDEAKEMRRRYFKLLESRESIAREFGCAESTVARHTGGGREHGTMSVERAYV